MIEKFVGGGRNVCAVQFREREIRIERDCFIEVLDRISEPKIFGQGTTG
jgi:hypothetical protein